MKKIIIPALILAIAFSLVTPVHAQEESKNSWFSGFSKFFEMFGIFKNDMPPIDDFQNVKLSPTVTITLPPGNDETREGKKYFDRPGIPERPTSPWPTKELRPKDVRPTKTYTTPQLRPTKNYMPTGSVRPTKEMRPYEPRPTKDMQEPDAPKWGNGDKDGPRGPSGSNGKTKSEIIGTIVSRMLDSYENRLSNYQDFLAKVKSRRDKLAENSDVTKLDAYIKTATENLADAKQKFTDVKTKASAQNVKGLLASLRQITTDLHKSMSEVVSEVVKSSAPAGATGSQFKSKPLRPGIPTGEWGANSGGQYMQKRENRPATGAWGGGGGN